MNPEEFLQNRIKNKSYATVFIEGRPVVPIHRDDLMELFNIRDPRTVRRRFGRHFDHDMYDLLRCLNPEKN